MNYLFFALKIISQKSKSGGKWNYERVQEGNSDRENTEEIVLSLAKFLKHQPRIEGHASRYNLPNKKWLMHGLILL